MMNFWIVSKAQTEWETPSMPIAPQLHHPHILGERESHPSIVNFVPWKCATFFDKAWEDWQLFTSNYNFHLFNYGTLR